MHEGATGWWPVKINYIFTSALVLGRMRVQYIGRWPVSTSYIFTSALVLCRMRVRYTGWWPVSTRSPRTSLCGATSPTLSVSAHSCTVRKIRQICKFVSIRKEAILSVPYDVYSMLSMFHCKKIRELHVQKICEDGQGKNPRDTGTSLADRKIVVKGDQSVKLCLLFIKDG